MTSEPTTQGTPDGRPLRVLMGCDTFAPDVNGAARFAERLSAGLVKRGHNVRVAAPAPNRTHVGAKIERIEGVDLTLYRLPSHKLWGHDWIWFVAPWKAREVARTLLDTFEPDAIHVQSHLLVGRGLAIEAANRGVRIIATNHIMPENIIDLDSAPKWFQRLFLKWAWGAADRVLRRAEAITTPTRRAADFLERNTSRRGVLPVSCGIEAANYTPCLEQRTSNRLVFVGRVTLEKQIDVVIRALAHISPELDVEFDIVGVGDQRENLEKLARELGVRERIVWHGKLPDEDLRAVLTRGSIFTIASIAELQSIATMEAMASGLPVVAANAMALPHLINEGENGHLFEPGNDRELAERITRILQLPHGEYVRMQRASLALVEDHDIDRTLDTFEALYRGELPIS